MEPLTLLISAHLEKKVRRIITHKDKLIPFQSTKNIKILAKLMEVGKRSSPFQEIKTQHDKCSETLSKMKTKKPKLTILVIEVEFLVSTEALTQELFPLTSLEQETSTDKNIALTLKRKFSRQKQKNRLKEDSNDIPNLCK